MIKIEKTPLHLVIAEHGAVRVLMAALLALVTVKAYAREPFLSDHICRDIGLPPPAEPPAPPNLPVRW